LLQAYQAAAALAWLQNSSQNSDSYITLQQGSCWTVKIGSAQIAYVAAAPSYDVLQQSSQQTDGTCMTHHVKETP